MVCNDLLFGLMLSLLSFIDEVVIFDIVEVQRLNVEGVGGCFFDFVFGDENFVCVSFIVQYCVIDLVCFFFVMEDVKVVFEQVVCSVFVEVIVLLVVDDFLIFGKFLVQEMICVCVQDCFGDLGVGVLLIVVNFQDVELLVEVMEVFCVVVDIWVCLVEQVSCIESQEEQVNVLVCVEVNCMVCFVEVDVMFQVQLVESLVSVFDVFLLCYWVQFQQI